MPTTRQRINLTLTEMEQRFLEAIVTDGTDEQEIFDRHLESRYRPHRGQRSTADVVHVLLGLGIERLEEEAAEISYAAEAEARTDADRAAARALRQRLAATAAGDSA